MHQAQAFFVIRGKSNLLFRRIYSRPVDKSTGLYCDQTIVLTAPKAGKDYPQHLRRIKFYDAEHVLTEGAAVLLFVVFGAERKIIPSSNSFG